MVEVASFKCIACREIRYRIDYFLQHQKSCFLKHRVAVPQVIMYIGTCSMCRHNGILKEFDSLLIAGEVSVVGRLLHTSM